MILELKQAYKQGFRWKPAGYAIAPTPSDTAPVSVWANSAPVYPIIPVDSIIPTGAGLGSTWAPGSNPSPFALGPVPPIQSHIPNPRLRFSQKPETSTRSTTRSSRSRSRPEPSRTEPESTSAPTALAVPAIVVAPVTVRGVPGSTIVGIDTVSDVQH